jgi:hypothetical protein
MLLAESGSLTWILGTTILIDGTEREALTQAIGASDGRRRKFLGQGHRAFGYWTPHQTRVLGPAKTIDMNKSTIEFSDVSDWAI